MRRRADGFNGVMEFLIGTAALDLRDEGAEFLSLSGAPLARVDRGDEPDAVQRLLDVLGRIMEPVYGFRSLLDSRPNSNPSTSHSGWPTPTPPPCPASPTPSPSPTSRTSPPDTASRLLRKLRR